MSVIKIEISVDKSNVAIVSDFLNRIAVDTAKAANLKVVGAEEVKTAKAEPAKTPAKRPSRAKQKPVVVEEDEDEDFGDDEEEDEDFGDDEEGDDEEAIDIDAVKDAMAEKVDDHRTAILKKLKALGASKMSELKPAKYEEFYNYLKKLK